MTREELLKIAKPVLFNTVMVIAILEDRKTATRRVVKPKHKGASGIRNRGGFIYDVIPVDFIDGETKIEEYQKPPYAAGDYLYVRETWINWNCSECEDYECENCIRPVAYLYKADGEVEGIKWKPSIHMPKEAARIFLKVTDVRVERLHDITEEQAKAEGIGEEWAMSWWKPTYSDPDSGGYPRYRDTFVDLWNSTIKKADLDKYGWDANPWVWVIEFERVEV